MAVIPFSSTGKFNTQTAGIAVSDGTYDQVDLLRIPDVDPMFHMLNDGSALFYRILSMLAKEEAATQPRFEFFEDDKYSVRTTVNGAVASTTEATVTFTDAILTVNTLAYNNTTGECMLVNTDNATVGEYECTRGVQGTTAANIGDGDEIILLGGALPEGADANGGIALLPSKNHNYTSFFSQGCNSTDVQELTDMLNGAGQLNNEFRKQTLFLMEQIDQHLRYSTRDTAAHADGQLYYTGGFKHAQDDAGTEIVTEEVFDISDGDFAWTNFNTVFNPYFEPTSSSPTKTLLCGQTMFSRITGIGWDHFTSGGTPTFQTSLGATVQQIVLDGGGIIDVVLDKYGFKSGTSESDTGFLLDLNNIKLKSFNGFDMTWREVTQPQSHTKKFELFSSAGLKLLHGDTHAVISTQA